jgi:DNA-binding transcriptional MocR family regulator
MILGRITAQEKVGSFILAMADRLSNGRSDRVTLPISRYDIADYLAVSVETVSRALSELKHRGLIRFTGTRVIQIIDREALEDGEHDDVLEPTPPAERTSAHPLSARVARTESRTASAN